MLVWVGWPACVMDTMQWMKCGRGADCGLRLPLPSYYFAAALLLRSARLPADCSACLRSLTTHSPSLQYW